MQSTNQPSNSFQLIRINRATMNKLILSEWYYTSLITRNTIIMAGADCRKERSKSFNWKIQYPYYFSDCNISSPSFSIDSCGFTRYQLDFVSEEGPTGIYDVSLYLQRHEWHSEPGDILLDIKINVICDNIEKECRWKKKLFRRERIFQKIFSNNTSECITEKVVFLMNVAKGSKDTNILVQLDIAQHIVSEEIEDLWAWNLEDLESLSSDIAGILHKKQFYDITFKSNDDKPVRLHRAILASRYSTLANFLNILETQKEYKLEADYDGITLLLRYLYSGKINITDSIFELYKLLRRAPLFHLQDILYSEPDYVVVSTSVPLKHGSFVFSIPNFNELQNDSEVVNYISCDNLLLWTHLRVVLFIAENADGQRSVAFKIQRMEQDGKLLMLSKISLFSKESYSEFFQVKFESEREKVLPSFIKINEIHERENIFLKDGTLKLGFDVVLSNLVQTSESGPVEYAYPEIDRPFINLCVLRKDIASLYRKPNFSDISIKVRNSKIPAHKIILCARSPVFSQILENETKKKSIVLNNYDSSIVLDLLLYMYGGILCTEDKSYEWAFNLYKAANEYQVAQLKRKCIQFIEKSVNPDNASRVLKFAIECDIDSLQKVAKSFTKVKA